MWASPPAMAVPQVAANKMRVLACFGPQRHPAFPDVPTLKELGYDVEYYVWSGLFVPAGTPEPILTALRDAIRKAVASPEFVTAIEKMKTPIPYLDAPEFRDFLTKDAPSLRQVVQRIGKIE